MASGYALNYGAIIEAANNSICKILPEKIKDNSATILTALTNNLIKEMVTLYKGKMKDEVNAAVQAAFETQNLKGEIMTALKEHLTASTEAIVTSVKNSSTTSKIKQFGKKMLGIKGGMKGSRKNIHKKSRKTRKLRKTKSNRRKYTKNSTKNKHRK